MSQELVTIKTIMCEWCDENEAIENIHGYDLCKVCITKKVVVAV